MSITQWEMDARRLLKAQLALKGVGTRQLAERLQVIGEDITPGAVANKISRGSFSLAFFLQCCHVLDVEGLSLHTIETKFSERKK